MAKHRRIGRRRLSVAVAVLLCAGMSTSAMAWDRPEWVRQLGTSGGDGTTGVATDHDGNVYISGSTLGSLGGDNAGQADAFLAKYSPVGALRWMRQLGTSGGDYASGIATDRDGNVYIGGSTTGSLDGANKGEYDAFVAKYSPEGKLRWTRQLGTSVLDYGSGVATDLSGNVYITGLTRGSLGSAKQGGLDSFIAKYSANGALRWMRQYGKPQDDYYSRAVAADRNGNIYIAGTVLEANGAITLAFVASYSADGGFRWERQPRPSTPSDLDEGNGVAIDDENDIYIAGHTPPGDAFVSRYSADGALRWTRQFGTPSSDDAASGVATDRKGNVYISEVTEGSLGGINQGSVDAFVAKYAKVGALRWIRQLGTSESDYASGVATHGDGSVYLSGGTSGSLGGANRGGADAFVAKFATRR